MKCTILFISAALCLIAGCQKTASPATIELSYHNPVWDGYLADPQVLYSNGRYYAYGTGKAPDGRQFPVLRSDDFAHWTYVGGALEPSAGPAFNDYWAPEAIEHNGKFYLYYAGDCKMRVAVADTPEGPFKDSGKLLFPDEPFSIDGHPFFDSVSRQWYLFFAKDFFDQRVGTALAVVKLADDMISTEGPVTTVLRAFADWQIYERNRTLYNKHWDAWHTVEGPYVVYKDGKYYCFYSGGNWQTPGYGVGCAVADSILGPYKDNWSKDKASVLSTIPDKLIGPGHNSVVLAPDRETYFIVYHSWNPQRTARQMCIDPLVWTNNGPKALNPSRGPKKLSIPLPDNEVQ
jgi:beta-xylosidase